MTKFLKTSVLLACILSSFAITAHASEINTHSWESYNRRIGMIEKLLISNPAEGQAQKVQFCTEFKNSDFCKQ